MMEYQKLNKRPIVKIYFKPNFYRDVSGRDLKKYLEYTILMTKLLKMTLLSYQE